MAGKVEDYKKLQALEEVDNTLENGVEAFNNSPIAKEIAEVRSKKAEYKAKRDQLDSVFVKARDEVAAVSAKDSELAAAQDKTQKEIEEIKGDYRKVEAHTKKLNELTEQRKKVDEKLEIIEANFNKIKELKSKVDDAIGSVSLKEDDLTKKLEAENVQLKLKMEKANLDKINIEKDITDDVLEIYKKARNNVGQKVIAVLQGDTCSVCKSSLSNAAVSKVQNEAPISTCPSCHRVLFVDTSE